MTFAVASGDEQTLTWRELEDWAQRIELWRERIDVYAYFNNDWLGFAVKNGRWLKKRLQTAT